ncbi:MAG: carbohydrate ABC transporter permease [Chloroflexota bacterium]
MFHDSDADLGYKAKWWTSRAVIYGLLILWTIIALFPIFWTITTSFKTAPDVMAGSLIPFLDFEPSWLGWRSLGLSPETIGADSTVRDQFLSRFTNTVIVSVSASTLAVFLGSITGYGLSRYGYKFGPMKNADISFFFISQLILPPIVLALPFLVFYRELGLIDTHIGLILLYTLTVLPIVIWIMRDQFMSIPPELEEAALVEGVGVWGAFTRIILPIALPGMIAAFVLALVLTWNEYFFAVLLTATNSITIPVLVASQTGSQGINWWAMAAISFAAILPLIIVAILLERFIVRGMSAGAVK